VAIPYIHKTGWSIPFEPVDGFAQHPVFELAKNIQVNSIWKHRGENFLRYELIYSAVESESVFVLESNNSHLQSADLNFKDSMRVGETTALTRYSTLKKVSNRVYLLVKEIKQR
jgi:hypothetical protein